MRQVVFVHGMFQNPKSWDSWIRLFSSRGYSCLAPAWPLHEGDPAALRSSPPAGLGDLGLDDIIASIEPMVAGMDRPIMIGHSVGGLITQILLSRNLLSAGVAISSVAPNDMIELNWGFLKNSTLITNPLKGNEPIFMDAKTFHSSFANTLDETAASAAYAATATHDSRNVLRDCLGPTGHIDLSMPHEPLLLIAGGEDQIIPARLVEKNADGYDAATGSATAFRAFPNRSHFICNEPGWEEVAAFVLDWLQQQAGDTPLTVAPASIGA